MKDITLDGLTQRISLYDKGIICDEELMSHIKDDSGNFTFPNVVWNDDFEESNEFNKAQILMQLEDKQLVTAEEIRKYFGYEPADVYPRRSRPICGNKLSKRGNNAY